MGCEVSTDHADTYQNNTLEEYLEERRVCGSEKSGSGRSCSMDHTTFVFGYIALPSTSPISFSAKTPGVQYNEQVPSLCAQNTDSKQHDGKEEGLDHGGDKEGRIGEQFEDDNAYQKSNTNLSSRNFSPMSSRMKEETPTKRLARPAEDSISYSIDTTNNNK